MTERKMSELHVAISGAVDQRLPRSGYLDRLPCYLSSRSIGTGCCL